MTTLRRQLDIVQLLIAPIESLPNELLSEIIRSACTTVEKPPPHTPARRSALLFIPPPMSVFSETPKFSTSIATLLTFVCKRWRLVIEADLTLWSNVEIRPTDANLHSALGLAVTHATRSDPAPMSVSVSDYTENPLAAIHFAHFINNNSQRIRELKAYFRVMGGLSSDFNQLRAPMPNLEVLELGCSPHSGTLAGAALPQLFSHNYPRLKHLSIQHFITIPPRAFTDLVTLVLSYSNGRVTLEDFLALVAGSPRLEVLWLKRYLVSPSVNPQPPASVSLPRLSSITLENCDSHLILSVLRLPDTAALRVMYAMYYLGRRPQNALSDAFPLNPATVGSLNNIRTLSYGVDDNTAVLFLKDSEGDKLVHVEQGRDLPDLGPFHFFGRRHAGLRPCFHDLFALEQAADLLGNLTTLELDLRGLPNHDMGGSRLSFWLAFFESSSRLEVLRASYMYLPMMLDGLNPSNNSARKVLCPSLRTLQLDILTGAFDLKNDWLLQVIDTTRWRGKCGSPFRVVSVYLMSSGYGNQFTLPSDAVRAMFTLRDAGVENMTFSNGIKTYRFGESLLDISTSWGVILIRFVADKDNYTLPELPQPFWEDWAATTAHKTTHGS